MEDYRDPVTLYAEFEKDAVPPISELYSFALRMTGRKRKAKKLLLVTYKKAFWFFKHLDKSIEVKGWLFRVMRNAYLNKFKDTSRGQFEETYKEAESFYNKIKSGLPDISHLEKEIISRISDNNLSEILTSLPEDLRIVLILCDIQGFSYEEISDFVDVPLGVAISRLRKARIIFFAELYKRIWQK